MIPKLFKYQEVASQKLRTTFFGKFIHEAIILNILYLVPTLLPIPSVEFPFIMI